MLIENFVLHVCEGYETLSCVGSPWVRRLVMRWDPNIKFPTRNNLSWKTSLICLPKLWIGMCSRIAKCAIASNTCDLWMSHVAFDTFYLVVNFINGLCNDFLDGQDPLHDDTDARSPLQGIGECEGVCGPWASNITCSTIQPTVFGANVGQSYQFAQSHSSQAILQPPQFPVLIACLMQLFALKKLLKYC